MVPTMQNTYDAIVIGAGHNGLVTACYLARAGYSVLVLERRYVVGGACVTEEIFPGFKVSTAAYVNSLFRKEIVADLRLKEYGFEVLERNPSSFSPYPDGRYLLLGPDADLNHREISKFSRKDADAYPQYEAMLERVAGVIEPTLDMTPPNPQRPRFGDLWKLFQLGRSIRNLGPALGEAVEILTGPARPILDRWFESEELKATLATDAVIGAMAAPSMPGTAYVLFHHVMGETNGKRGVWGYVRGGMGGLTQALAKAAQSLGVTIRCEAEVSRILTKDGAIRGVALANGDEFLAPVVASNADACVTFTKLMEANQLPTDFAAAVDRINYDSASLKINVALSELPNFRACPGLEAGLHHRGTIHICPDLDTIERAFDDAKYGRPSTAPYSDGVLPTMADDSLAPPGKHVMSCFTQYVPAAWSQASHAPELEAYADRVIDGYARFAPNLKSAIEQREVIGPYQMEQEYGLVGGNIMHGDLTLDQLFSWRPVAGYADYRTPLRGLYLCGAGTHPGGGVSGINARNASREIVKDWKRLKRS